MNKHHRDLLKSTVEAKIGQLPEREQRVLKMRFGLDGHDPASLKQCGEVLGITVEGVRKIETRALERLKESA